jgi:hypothetical protein
MLDTSMRKETPIASTWVHPGFDGVHVAHLFCFLCCVFCFDSLRTLSCVPNVTSFTELFILDLSLTNNDLQRTYK